MGKRSKKRANGGRRKSGTTSMHFRYVLANVFSASATTYTFTIVDLTAANLGPRIAAAAPDFEYFRIKSMSLNAFTDSNQSLYDATAASKQGITLGLHAIAFHPDAVSLTGTPTSFGDMTQYRHIRSGAVKTKLGIRVANGQIFGDRPIKWFNTTATGTPPTGQKSSGMLVMMTYNVQSTNNPGNQYCVIEGVVEFRGEVAPSLAFMNQYNPSVTQLVTVGDPAGCHKSILSDRPSPDMSVMSDEFKDNVEKTEEVKSVVVKQ